jgi:hypothetical protein
MSTASRKPRRSTTDYYTTDWSVRRLYNESDFKARFENGSFQIYPDTDKLLSDQEVATIHDAMQNQIERFKEWYREKRLAFDAR